MTLRPFSLDSLEDPAIHLTNAAIQKQTEEYKDKEKKEFQVKSFCMHESFKRQHVQSRNEGSLSHVLTL